MKIPERIFLVGCPRSGTTLLQSLIAAHPQITSFPESDFFTALVRDIKRRIYGEPPNSFKDKLSYILRNVRVIMGLTWPMATAVDVRIHEFLSKIEREYLLSCIPKKSLFMNKYVNCFINILDMIAKEENNSIWLEKTPNHICYIDIIERFVPGAKFIHIVRNGADVVASIYDAATQNPHVMHDFPSDVDQCIKRWNIAIKATLKNRNKINHKIVHYEQLCEQPELVLVKLCEFIGVNFDADMLKEYILVAKRISPGLSTVDSPIRNVDSVKFNRIFSDEKRQYIHDRLLPIADMDI